MPAGLPHSSGTPRQLPRDSEVEGHQNQPFCCLLPAYSVGVYCSKWQLQRWPGPSGWPLVSSWKHGWTLFLYQGWGCGWARGGSFLEPASQSVPLGVAPLQAPASVRAAWLGVVPHGAGGWGWAVASLSHRGSDNIICPGHQKCISWPWQPVMNQTSTAAKVWPA